MDIHTKPESNCFKSKMRDRNVKFFEITGRTLVHPISYHMQEFQKHIITTAVTKNTLISLPPGLGMPYLSSLIVFNFQRWFLNGRIVVLSQTKNFIVEQMNAYSSFTTLSEDHYSDLYGNTSTENQSAWNKPIILTTPVKFLDSIKNNVYNINNLILLIIYETNKIAKCQEYKDIMSSLNDFDIRVVVFVDGCGFNVKIVKQIIDMFDISQLEIRKLSSPDIQQCTFCSEIESVALDITPHMISIKDAFYAVYEKYGKLLKDARVINGNIASFTKSQIQKAREKLIKTPPPNMNKDVQQNLLDSMAMCSFLCTGIDILHNWGVRSFYNYLFDENKDGELKVLIVQDELLKNQMKLLNEYLKSNGKRVESLMSRIIHPKLLYLKNLITKHFSEADLKIEDVRIVIYCSMEEIIDDINRLLGNLPDYVRHQCVKTKAKSLQNTNEYKEVIKNFNDGIINVLVISNLVEEVNELKSNLIVSLEPNKTLLKFSDPRFYKGPDKCFFVLTKGSEYNKFESLLNEKRNEQKSVDIPEMNQILKESPRIFPEDFNPEFESTSVISVVSKSNNFPGQSSMLNYLTTDKGKKSKKSLILFDESDVTDTSLFAPNGIQKSPPPSPNSPSLFSNFSKTVTNAENDLIDLSQDERSFHISPQPVPYHELMGNAETKENDYDSFDELLLDFTVDQSSKVKKPEPEPLSNASSNKENDFGVLSDEEDFKSKNDTNQDSFRIQSEKNPKISRLELLRDRAKNLKLFSRDDCPSTFILSPEIKPRSPSILENETDIFNDLNSSTLQREMFKDFSFNTSKRTNISTNKDKTPLNGFTTLSPILSSKKSNKKLSRSLFPIKDCSQSIHFDSTFEIDDNFTMNLLNGNELTKSSSNPVPSTETLKDDTLRLRESEPSIDKWKENLQSEPIIDRWKEKTNSPAPAPNIDDWDPDCELFEDDDTFDAIAHTVTPQKEIVSVKTSTPAIKPKLVEKPLSKPEKKTDDCDNFSINCNKKPISNSFFANFSLSLKQRSQTHTARNISPVKESKPLEKDDDDSADEFPWMTKSKPAPKPKLKVSPNQPEEYPWLKKFDQLPVPHITPDFKKPGPFVIRSSKSRSVTPGTPHTGSSTGSDGKSISRDSTPDSAINRNLQKKKKNINLKRNLARQFLDNEAEATDDDCDTIADDCSHISDEDNSFIDDEVPKNSTYSHYLKSLKSPRTTVGKFHIPVLSESKLKMNVCSQMDYFDQTYQNDSFCVDDVPDHDSEYVPSILTQMEDKLKFEKKKKTKRITRISDGSSDESTNSPNHRKKKHRKRIVCFSSDSD